MQYALLSNEKGLVFMYMRLKICVSGCIMTITAMMYLDRLLISCDLNTKGKIMVKALSTVIVADIHVDN